MKKTVRAGYYYGNQFKGYTLCECYQVPDLKKGDFVVEQNDCVVCGEVARIWKRKDGYYTIKIK